MKINIYSFFDIIISLGKSKDITHDIYTAIDISKLIRLDLTPLPNKKKIKK